MIEQAVYGSFPFWNRGYAVLSRSSGCRPEWLAALKQASQRYGERPPGVAEAQAMFARKIERGPWMIVGVAPQGEDDAGRPGALAFHALFVGSWSYLRAGADPFSFAGLHRREWSPDDLVTTLPSPSLDVRASTEDSDEGSSETIAQAITAGRQVVVPSAGPIDVLAQAVWKRLTLRVRLRASVATWAFDNANRFDLVAMPRLSAAGRVSSEMVLGADLGGTQRPVPL